MDNNNTRDTENKKSFVLFPLMESFSTGDDGDTVSVDTIVFSNDYPYAVQSAHTDMSSAKENIYTSLFSSLSCCALAYLFTRGDGIIMILISGVMIIAALSFMMMSYQQWRDITMMTTAQDKVSERITQRGVNSVQVHHNAIIATEDTISDITFGELTSKQYYAMRYSGHLPLYPSKAEAFIFGATIALSSPDTFDKAREILFTMVDADSTARHNGAIKLMDVAEESLEALSLHK